MGNKWQMWVVAGCAGLVAVGCGSPGAPSASDATSQTKEAAADDSVVIAAVGDIACATDSSSYNDGKGIDGKCRQVYTADAAAGFDPVAVLALGDNQYPYAELADFETSFGTKESWGRFLDTTDKTANKLWPVPGNHEYGDFREHGDPKKSFADAPGYWPSFNGGTEANPNSSGIAGTTHEGWYSMNIGQWHVIALNGNCTTVKAGMIPANVKCDQGSAQYEWLSSDLAANSAKCTLAYWHSPLFTQGKHGGGTKSGVQPFWDLLSKAKADIVLNGHNHSYERFAPLDATGAETADGVREFVVGTGGKDFYEMRAHDGPKPEVWNNDTMGVLKLTLDSDSYTWEFVRAGYEGNGTFTDTGSGVCH